MEGNPLMSDAGGAGKVLANIPGYELERELGRGGFAVVYRANQPKLRRTVALKVLTNVDPTDDDAKRRFESECHAIGSLSWHPHVVTVYDAGATEEGLPFLAMENLPSGSLQAKLADHGPAPWEEILRVTVQMCDALGAAHQAGILHEPGFVDDRRLRAICKHDLIAVPADLGNLSRFQLFEELAIGNLNNLPLHQPGHDKSVDQHDRQHNNDIVIDQGFSG